MSRKQKAAPVQASKPKAAPRQTLQARYDAAQTTKDNMQHWSHADHLDANSAASPAVRRILRSRCRYEVANNSYARGIVNFIAMDTIGGRIVPQMLTEDRVARRLTTRRSKRAMTRDEAAFVEGEFLEWLNATNMIQKLWTLRAARAVDGDGFGVQASNPKLAVPVKLDLMLVEADQITSDIVGMPLTPNEVDGIVFDAFGNPVTYRMLKEHPGSTGIVGLGEAVELPASRVIHLFSPDRPGQRRGIPQITPALPLFAQLRRFTLAVIAAAETAADFAGVMYTRGTPGDEPVSGSPFDRIEIERRALLTLPEGWEMGQFKPEQPVSTYAEFKREILGEICRPLDVPLNVALGDSSRHNYASGRLDWQIWMKARRFDRRGLELTVLDRLFSAWQQEAVLIEGYLPQTLRMTNVDWSHLWLWDGDEHVDPQKEASAQTTRLQNCTTTLAEEWAKKGRDWEDAVHQIARERNLLAELGIPLAAAAPLVQDEPEDPPAAAEASLMLERDPAGRLLGLRRG